MIEDIIRWWDNWNAKMLDDMINFVPTPKSILINVVTALIMMDVLISFTTMFRNGVLSKILNWWWDRK